MNIGNKAPSPAVERHTGGHGANVFTGTTTLVLVDF